MSQTINQMLDETTESTYVRVKVYDGLLSQFNGQITPELCHDIVDSTEIYEDLEDWLDYSIEPQHILKREEIDVEQFSYENEKTIIIYLLDSRWKEPSQEQLEEFLEVLEECQSYENYSCTISHSSGYDKDSFLAANPEERENMLSDLNIDLHYLESIEEWASLLSRARTKFANDKDMLEFIEECDENWDFMNDDEVEEFRRVTDIWD